MNAPICHFDMSSMDDTVKLGEALALALRPGDVLAVSGDLGAGKTTLLRALIQAFSDDLALEVPSPTYTLLQSYDGANFRFPLHHADFYRVNSPDEIEELGLGEHQQNGALLIEWPEKANGALPAHRFDLHLESKGEARTATLSSTDDNMRKRLTRLCAIQDFLHDCPHDVKARRFLQGDASPRAYERLTLKDGKSAVLLNALAQPDRSVGEHRLNYMKVTHLAPNDAIAPILALGAELRQRGFTVPEHLHYDVDGSLLIQEDLGSGFIAENSAPVLQRYQAAIDVLVALHQQDWPQTAKGPANAQHQVPVYSREAFQTEAKLFLEFFLPTLTGRKTDPVIEASFRSAFDGLFDSLDRSPKTWTLFDFHSPNAMWLEDRDGLRRIGLLDFQDTRQGPEAYDVVSLAQDARVSVPVEMEHNLLERYLQARATDKKFDAETLKVDYAICGAQRATRILGVFARLAHQDGKPHYLQHIPRVSDYLERCLVHPKMKALKVWFDNNAPAQNRVSAMRAA